jgi:hypothetical protein
LSGAPVVSGCSLSVPHAAAKANRNHSVMVCRSVPVQDKQLITQ